MAKQRPTTDPLKLRAGSRIVVALGGNALVRPGENVTIATQARNIRRAMKSLLPLLRAGHRLVLTHGNGFQVGNLLIRVEEALGKAYSVPLEVCVAESQGELGYLIEQGLQNELGKNGIRVPVVSVLTQVIVDANDPAFDHPTKPVGPYYTKRQANALKRRGWHMTEDSGRGWRRVVASPDPTEIDDVEILQWLLRRGAIVIAAGGGGVPVVRDRGGALRGVPAVIDKDAASAILARAVRASHLFILTGEPSVFLDYETRRRRRLRTLRSGEAKRHLETGQFAPGSMGPRCGLPSISLREAAVRHSSPRLLSSAAHSPVERVPCSTGDAPSRERHLPMTERQCVACGPGIHCPRNSVSPRTVFVGSGELRNQSCGQRSGAPK